jgi:RNA polymerase sigma-70 factor (ECF subfamily)
MGRTFKALLIAEHLPAMHRYARALTRDDVSAEDLVHETLIKAYDNRHSFRTGADPRPWLFTILHNLFVSGWRRGMREQAYIAGASKRHPDAVPPSQEHALRLQALDQAFQKLSDDHRAVLHLVVVEGLAYQEAAEVLGLPIGTLISRLSRARAALRDRERIPQRADAPALRIVRGSHD